MVKIGIIKCKVTDSYNGLCPGRSCFSSAKLKQGKFGGYEDEAEIVAFGHCGGCPGRNAAKVAKIMKEECGAELIHLSSCTFFANPECPYLENMKKSIQENTQLKVVKGTHSRKTCKLNN